MIRIQKYLANIGFGARRSIEELIISKKVKLNDEVCEVGAKVKVGDVILINKNKIVVKKEDFDTIPRLLIYNKPLGEVCTTQDEKGRRTVFDNLPKLKKGKWINVGRLDINTSGLLLFTTDGDLANKYMHPSSNYEREYLTKIHGDFTESKKQKLLKGVKLDDGFGKFTKISAKNNNWYSVIITEGRNREVRRLFQSQNLMVSKLVRIRFGKIRLPKDLQKGSFIEIDAR